MNNSYLAHISVMPEFSRYLGVRKSIVSEIQVDFEANVGNNYSVNAKALCRRLIALDDVAFILANNKGLVRWDDSRTVIDFDDESNKDLREEARSLGLVVQGLEVLK